MALPAYLYFQPGFPKMGLNDLREQLFLVFSLVINNINLKERK